MVNEHKEEGVSACCVHGLLFSVRHAHQRDKKAIWIVCVARQGMLGQWWEPDGDKEHSRGKFEGY